MMQSYRLGPNKRRGWIVGDVRRVLVVGAAGLIGGIVRRHLGRDYELSYLDRQPAPFVSHVADIRRLASIRPAFAEIDAVLHLAAASSVDSSWDDVLGDNLTGTYNVFEAAREQGVRRVVFASSNHVVGMYETDGAPNIYDLADLRSVDSSSPIRPDSLYGASKAFGEALGRLYADRYGMDVVCLRIGIVREDDDPARADAGRPFSTLPMLTADESRHRLRATWLSHRDCAQLIRRALEAPVHWAVVYGVSDNPRRIWDLQGARDLLGFDPEDAAPE
jgi:nucleoside-diphosphate-sugar epimerase